ncbi:MAG: ATP-binding protein [Alphaproteobacteria bacterium]
MRNWLQARDSEEAELISALPAFPGMAKSSLLIGGIVFAILGVAHLFVLQPPLVVPLAALAFGSSALMLGARLAFWTGFLPFSLIRCGVFLACVMGWLNSTVHLWLTGDPMQLTNLAVVAVLAGAILLDREQFVAIYVASVCSWLTALLSATGGVQSGEWLHFSIFLGEAMLLGTVLFFWRRRDLLLHISLRKERERSRSSEHLSLLAAQSKAIEAERNLRRALEADASKSMFLANMSHELRTPLNSVVGFAQLLKDRPEIAAQPGRVHEYAECIHSSGTHLLELINQILDLSRANAGGMSLNETRVDVGDTAIEITRLLSPQAAQAKVGLHVHAAPRQHVIRGDDLRIRQILTNLVANAVKFTPAGGRVDVSVGRDGSGLVLEVRDTGFGIAMQDIGRVFEPFVQADGAMSRRHQGTGLGLAITRRLVELHGGAISVKSAPGEGSVFTVRFPVERIEDVPMRSAS